MKKTLLITLVSAVVLSGATFATQILETKPTTEVKKPVVRPSLTKILDKRPALPGAKSTTGAMLTGRVQPPLGTGKIIPMGTGSVKSNTGSAVKQIVQQNAEDVKAYREENGYIVRYLKKPATAEEKKTMGSIIETAVKALIAEQKKMTAEFHSGTITSQAIWDSRSQLAVDSYKAAVANYIDADKSEGFEKFLIGRVNLMKGLFAKLELIHQIKGQSNNPITNTDSATKPVKEADYTKLTSMKSFEQEMELFTSFIRVTSNETQTKVIKSAVDKAINDFIAEQKNMMNEYAAGTLVGQSAWEGRVDKAVEAFKTALLPNIEPSVRTAVETLLKAKIKYLKADYANIIK